MGKVTTACPETTKALARASYWMGMGKHLVLSTSGITLPTPPIDEVSLFFRKEDQLRHFVHCAKAVGLENFATVEQDMFYHDGPGNSGEEAFKVKFEFLKFPGWLWRIEAMTILEGTSPIHHHFADGSVAHLSFKYDTEREYDLACERLPNVDSLGATLVPLMAFRNSYGRFKYFVANPWTPYLKPRVNLRD